MDNVEIGHREMFFYKSRALQEKNKQRIIVARQLIQKSQEMVKQTTQAVARAQERMQQFRD